MSISEITFLELSYIQEIADAQSFDKPIARNLNSDTRLRFNGERQNFVTFNINQLKVETTSGSYKKVTETVEGLYFKSTTNNSSSRVPTDERETLLNGQVTPPERTPYVYIQFFLTNETQRVERDYPVIIDTLQNIGGVAEVLMFIFVYMMMLHHEVIMDLYLLNNAVLMNHFNGNNKKSRKNQVRDFRTQKTKLEHLPYTYSELISLKFFSC
jgi:hypothetical protein